MRHTPRTARGLAAVAGLALASCYSTAMARQPKILEFDTMVGIPPALTGASSQLPLRGVSGGGLPWTLTSAAGELKWDGKLEISVRGLVFAAGPNIGRNTVPFFRAMVSCVRSDGTFANVLTDPFPADADGNADIEAKVTLPQPCIAPIVFVTSPGGSWFAATGL